MIDWNAEDDPAERLHGFISGYHATQYVYTGVECGLFESLRTPKPPAQLAADLDLHPPYVRRFCEVGLRWGLLERRDDPDRDEASYHLRATFEPYIGDGDTVRDMRDLFRITASDMGEDYLDYPRYFRTGDTRPYGAREAAFSASIQGATRGLQTIFVDALVSERLPRFERQLVDGGRLVDVGCGAGHLACLFAERYPDIEVVGIDRDGDAIRLAGRTIERRGVADRVTVHQMDAAALSDRLGSFDAAVSFVSLHEIPAENRPAVFDALGRALAPEAAMAVFDEVYPDRAEDFRQPPYANGVESQWAELVWGNDIPTESEQRELLGRAELSETERVTFADRFVVFEAVRGPGYVA